MKPKIILFVCALLLAGCNKTPTPTTSNESSSITSNSSSTNVTLYPWTENEKSLMMTSLGMVLPDSPLTLSRKAENYIDITDNINTFYVIDETIQDVSEAYGQELLKANFTYDGKEDGEYKVYYYLKAFDEEHHIHVQIGYNPGDTENAAGYEIYAWKTKDAKILSAWRNESIQNMNQALGTSLPLPPISDQYLDLSYEDDDGTFIFCASDEEGFGNTEAYLEILEKDGFEIFGTSDEFGYTVYLLSKNAGNGVYLYVQVGDNKDDKTIDILAWKEVVASSWPTDEIIAVVGNEISIPSFEASEYYVYPTEGKKEVQIYGLVSNDNIAADYKDKIIKLGWKVVDATDSTPYFATQENYEIEFYDADGGYFGITVRYNGNEVPVIEGNIVLVPSMLGNSGAGYQDNVSITVSNIEFVYSSLARGNQDGNDVIQFRSQSKGAGVIQNKTAITAGIDTIEIKDIYAKNPAYAGSVSVYSLDEAGNKTLIEGNENVYSLAGAHYFMIENTSSYAFYCGAISIQFTK